MLALAALGGLAAGLPQSAQEAKAENGAVKITPEQAAFFESKVRPLLANNCYTCHADQQQRGGLRLDTKEGLFKGGAHGAILLAGDPEKSRLIQAIRYDGALKMPPAGKLRPEEIAALTAWVKMGAPWPEAKPVAGSGQPGNMVLTEAQRNFWSFRPVKMPALPAVKNTAWVRNPIDRFILAKLESQGLKPAPPADRRTLIRRVTYDLIGLPPSPEEVEAFVNDRSPNAWEKVIDRLLASPHYGERWGRHWLDLVRYADSNGLDENVAFANAWRYRDYVVSAFNQDRPYSQFIKEQLAGDLMPTEDENLRAERLTATGFLTLGPKLLAEPDKPKMVMDIVDEQIEVTSKAFLGLTVTCARCHNHKFDPIPTKDYYALAGIFKSTKTMSSLNTVAMWQERSLGNREYEAQKQAYDRQVKTAQEAVNRVTDRANEEALLRFRKEAANYLRGGWELAQRPDPETRSIAATKAKPGDPQRIYVEAIKYDRGNANKNPDGYGIPVIHTVQVPTFAEWDILIPTAGTYQVELRYAAAEPRPVKLLLNREILKESTAERNTGSFFKDGQQWEVEGVFSFKQGKNTLRIERNGDIPHFNRILIVPILSSKKSDGTLFRSPEQIATQYSLNVEMLKVVGKALRDRTDDPSLLSGIGMQRAIEDITRSLRPLLTQNAPRLYSAESLAALNTAALALKKAQENPPQTPMVMAVEDSKGENCRVHIRGDTQTLGDEVPRHFLTVLNGDKITIPDEKRSGRLELAEWIARPEHPLTARVEVNRIWQNHFGVGLVPTPDNWGFLGLKPTHPELLDWLASIFTAGVEEEAGVGGRVSGVGNREEGRGNKESRKAGNDSIQNPKSKIQNPTPDTRHPTPYACGWSLKKLHKLILLSNTYQMGTVPDAKTEAIASKADPDNTLLWKMPRRRLEAESFRDALLFVSGKLDLTLGGSLLKTKNHDYVTNDQSGNAAQYGSPRRGLYLPIIRNALYDMFQAFDYGDPSMVNAKRATTTVAPQALFVMNSPLVQEQAKAFAAGLLSHTDLSEPTRVRMAFLKAFSRPPTPEETARAAAFLTSYASRLASTEPDAQKQRTQAWQAFCHILYASNEFIYVN